MDIKDNSGRRSGVNRRQAAIPINFPDRRTGQERRSGSERRSGDDRRNPGGFRSLVGLDRRRSATKFSQLW